MIERILDGVVLGDEVDESAQERGLIQYATARACIWSTY